MYQALDGRYRDDNNKGTLVRTAKTCPKPLDTGLIYHSFLQLNRDYNY